MHNYKKRRVNVCINASLLGNLELTTQSSLLTTKKKDATG